VHGADVVHLDRDVVRPFPAGLQKSMDETFFLEGIDQLNEARST
jgi:hypothetical protein